MNEENLRRTPLYGEHIKLNAKMVAFGGWEMPVQYGSILEEYSHTRKEVTVFDTCHMGEFVVKGDARLTGLDYIVTQNIIDMQEKTCRYGAMLNKDGGVIDDLIVFRVGKNDWFIVVNAGTKDKDFVHIARKLTNKDCIKDISDQTGKIDVQGPKSRDVFKKIIKGIENLGYYCFDYFEYREEKVLVSRTGYTGELGFEVYLSSGNTVKLWQDLLNEKIVKPAGLGARDVLRLEMGYSLYGHELTEDISIIDSGLEKFIDFEKDFFGKEAVLKHKQSGLAKKMVGVLSSLRKSPREGYDIISLDNKKIGFCTSGSFSPFLNKGIGLAIVDADKVVKDAKVIVSNGQINIEAFISSRIFYKDGSLKN